MLMLVPYPKHIAAIVARGSGFGDIEDIGVSEYELCPYSCMQILLPTQGSFCFILDTSHERMQSLYEALF